MKLSELFLPVLKEEPREAEIISHKLMLRAGMIHKLSSGIYSNLPFGLMVLRRIEEIIRSELKNSGIAELLMPILQPSSLWNESKRYDTYGKEMLRVSDRHDNQMLFGPTNEEVITDIFRTYVKSYKDLPINLYQIQWKFRDEIRPRFGVMRGREFLMKDAYSFDIDEESATTTYKKYYELYLRIFRKLGVTVIPVKAANGEIGGSLSHEFHILTETGESTIYCEQELFDSVKNGNSNYEELKDYYAAADEMHDPEIEKGKNIIQARGIEVGHIFNFGKKYSENMKASVISNDNKKIFPNMGSYGIGISRVVAAIIESSHDAKGIIWPKNISPFTAIIVNLKPSDQNCSNQTNKISQLFNKAGLEILVDDMDQSIGQKFARADLIGIPYQITLGPRSLANLEVEVKNRKTGEKKTIKITDIPQLIDTI